MSAPRSTQVPEPVAGIVRSLCRVGHQACLVGGCVRDLERGAEPRDWDVATSALPEQVLALFPRAVPVGLRFGTVMVPTGAAGPVDVTTFRGRDLAADLARRDFTVNAMALLPREPETREAGSLGFELWDPRDGRRDLAQRRLRAVGSPRSRLGEDPLRALRAARLVAELGLEADDALRAALPEVGPALASLAVERVWSELQRLLQAPQAGRGLALLRESGLEARLAPGARTDADRVVDQLPRGEGLDRALRLAAWLRGTDAPRILARWRVSAPLVRAVEQILRHHPVEAQVAPREPAVRRWIRRAGGEANAARGLALREAELAGPPSEAEAALQDEAAREALARLRGLFEKVRGGALERRDLALDGREVMEALGRGPGPHVGAALRHLTDCVLEDPACNEPAALRALLAAWQLETAPDPASPDR